MPFVQVGTYPTRNFALSLLLSEWPEGSVISADLPTSPQGTDYIFTRKILRVPGV